MSDVIGRGILEVGGDSSQFEASMASAERAADKFEKGAVDSAGKVGAAFQQTGAKTDDALGKVDAATRRFLTSLERESQQVGRTRAEYLEMRAAQLGVSETAAAGIARIRESERAVNAYGLTTKQTTAALRQVPAQITDIFVSLQGGQAPLTVLLQQGGQLKDVFGGVVPAAGALGGALLKLVNPYTLVAAGVAALIFGYARGSAEADKYRLAIVGTGNAAGTSVRQLGDYARAVSEIVGTQAQAAETLAAFVSTGRVNRDLLVQFSVTAIETQRATGRAVADTVKEFAELGKDPVEASRKLTESQNYLTLGVLEQIKALKDQGREQEAATLAQVTYDRELKSRAAGIVENIGLFEKAWRRVKDATMVAIDALGNVGRAQTNAEKLAQARIALANVEARVADVRSGKTFAFEGGKALAERDLQAAQQRVRDLEREEIDGRVRASNRSTFARTQAEGLDAEKRLSTTRAESASNQEKLNKALREYRLDLEKVRAANPNSPLLDPARIAADEANIRERFKGPAARKPPAFTDSEATKQLQRYRETEAALREQLSSSEKLLGSQKELARFEQLIADLKEKKTLTADQKSVLAAEDAIRAQLRTNVEIERAVKLKADFLKKQEEIRAAEERFADRARQIQDAVEASQQAQREQYDDRLSVVGMGSQAREQLQAEIKIRREYQRYEAQLGRAAADNGTLGSEQYRKRLSELRLAQEQALTYSRDYFDRLQVLEQDWVLGAKAALIDYQDTAQRSAQSTYEAMRTGIDGLESNLAQFFVKGKADWKAYFTQIAIEAAKVNLIKPGLSTLFNLAVGFLGGGTGVGITGANTGGAGLVDLGLGAGRADGGSANAYSIHPVVERNEPEVFRTRKGTYLINGSDTGQVTPLRRIDSMAPAGGAGTGGGIRDIKITMVNNGTPMQITGQRRLSDDEILIAIDDRAAAATKQAVATVRGEIRAPNGSIRRDISSAFNVQRNV